MLKLFKVLEYIKNEREGILQASARCGGVE